MRSTRTAGDDQKDRRSQSQIGVVFFLHVQGDAVSTFLRHLLLPERKAAAANVASLAMRALLPAAWQLLSLYRT